MKRAIHNLVKNAIEASYQGDFIEIHTKVLSNKHKIRIDIVDHGHGMTEEVLRQANEPYFTTKEGGTGLGLSITQRIISEHGGEIEIQSKENQGTTISIFL